MKKIIFFALLMQTLASYAQNILSQRMEALPSVKAQIETRIDRQGRKCAIVLVDIVGNGDLKFQEAFGDVKYYLNEYTVYLTEGTEKLTIIGNNNKKHIVQFEEFDIKIESGNTYKLVLETEGQLRSACFYIQPKEAELVFDNEKISKNDNGIYVINKKIGKYQYKISAPGYKTDKGQIELSGEEFCVTKDIELEVLKYPVLIKCSHPTAKLFIDDMSYGTIENLHEDIMLPKGKHNIRVTNEECKDYEDAFYVNNSDNVVNVVLKEYKKKIIYHDNERTRSTGNYRPHVDVNLSGGFFVDDESKLGKVNLELHQYYGVLAFKEGFGIGAMKASDDKLRYLDDYYYKTFEMRDVLFTMDIPFQIGFAIPLSRFNTSHVLLLAGGYGAYYHIGHSPENVTYEEYVGTDSYDYGIRGNIQFYFKQISLSFEWNKSFSQLDMGAYIGVSLGVRFFYKKLYF